MAILSPAVNRSPHGARRSACKDNLQQVGLAAMQYMSEYDEHLPLLTNGQQADGETQSWRNALQPFIKSAVCGNVRRIRRLQVTRSPLTACLWAMMPSLAARFGSASRSKYHSSNHQIQLSWSSRRTATTRKHGKLARCGTKIMANRTGRTFCMPGIWEHRITCSLMVTSNRCVQCKRLSAKSTAGTSTTKRRFRRAHCRS